MAKGKWRQKAKDRRSARKAEKAQKKETKRARKQAKKDDKRAWKMQKRESRQAVRQNRINKRAEKQMYKAEKKAERKANGTDGWSQVKDIAGTIFSGNGGGGGGFSSGAIADYGGGMAQGALDSLGGFLGGGAPNDEEVSIDTPTAMEHRTEKVELSFIDEILIFLGLKDDPNKTTSIR